MAAVPEPQRLNEFRRLGFSTALIRLPASEVLHETFRYTCLGPPFYVYHQVRIPAGPTLIPLWDYNDTVIAVWEQFDGLDLIEFSIEYDGTYRSLARTEQGFWTTQFNFFLECDETFEVLREATMLVGFRFVEVLLASRTSHETESGGFDHGSWLNALVKHIDRESRLTGVDNR